MYHITKDGTVAECNAKPGNCPFGGIDTHFATIDEAYAVMGDIFGVLSSEDLAGTIYYEEFNSVMEDDELRNIFINEGMIGDVRVNPGFIFRSFKMIAEEENSPDASEMIMWAADLEYWIREEQDELELSNLILSNSDLVSDNLFAIDISDEVRQSLVKSKLIDSEDNFYIDDYGTMIGANTSSSGEVYVLEPEDFLGAVNEKALYLELSLIHKEPTFERSIVVEDLINSSPELRKELDKLSA